MYDVSDKVVEVSGGAYPELIEKETIFVKIN